MTKKRMVILLMLLFVMIMSIGAISAADANETLQGEVSDTNIALTDEVGDTNIATTSSDLKQEVNDTSPAIESVNDVDEINVDDSRNENHKVGVASSASNDVLSASDDDLLKSSGNNFYLDKTDKWYEDFEDALSAAESNGGGTIKIWGGTYKYTSDDDDFQYKINTKGTYTIQPYGSDHQVIFDGEGNGWFLHITNANIHVTISDITFKNGKGNDGPLEVEDGAQLTLYRCTFEGNHASSDGVSYGLGGAIIVDEGSLIANDCRFINNKADRHGGAICIEDSGSVTLNNCYFKGNKKGSDEENDFEDYDIDSGETPVWSFTNCLFVGSGDLHIDVDAPEKSVTITPVVDETINLVVLYKDGKFYDDNTGASGYSTTFTDLENGTYTVYLMEGSEKRYEYSGNTFTIIEPNFILNDERVFETLSDAISAIPNGGSGEIAVKGGTYTGSGNRGLQINNKAVTIRPKSDFDHVTFSGDRTISHNRPIVPSYFLTVGSNSKLTIEDITITGYFSDSALKFTAGSEGSISDCNFNNIKYTNNQPGNPINAQNSNLALDGCTFESNGPTLFKNTIVNIDDCTFTSNSGTQGGAINADSSTTLNVTNSEFNMNEANEGGAIYATNLELHGNEFIGNSANLGGAVYITSQSESLINMTYCVFDTNLGNYRNIYFESLTRKFNFEFNEYDLNLTIRLDDISYGSDSILYGNFDWGSNLNNTYTLLTGIADEENIFGDMVTVVNKKFELNLGVLPGGTHEIVMEGMYTQGDSRDHFWQHDYYSDLYQNEFYLINPAYAKIGIEKAKISLTLEVNDVLIPETPVLNVYADRDLNYTIFIQNQYYQVQVVNGKGSMQLTGLDLGNYTVVGMRDADENYYLIMNFTTFSVGKTYSNFLVVSTNVEYDTLAEAVSNSNREDTIYVKNSTYSQTGIVISDKVLEIVALGGAVFDANGRDANFIIVNENAMVDIYGITFRGIHNRNTNYGAIVNHGYLSLDSCNFTDNKITKTSFAENGGAAIFSDGYLLDIDNCNFINNVAPLKASTAAVTSVGHDDVSITDSKFINNTAREGGALHFKNITQFEAAVTSCDFERNTAVKGSAIYVGDNSRYLTVTSSGFKKNDIKNSLGEKTQLEGGVIYVNANNSDVIFDISLSNFEDNSNSNVDGGVICLDGCYKASIDSCIFTNNKGKVGSAILIKNPNDKKLSLFIDSSAFINNTATNGAIATSPKVTAFIDECVFANNTGENRHIYSNGFTVAHDSIFDVKDTKLNAPSVQYGESSTITGTADIGTNLYAAANLTVAGVNSIAEIKNNAFTYNAGMLSPGKYNAVLNSIVDNNNNTYLMDSITEILRVHRGSIEFNVSVDNITYGETLKVVESLPSTATGTIDYQLNGNYYTKDEIESLKLDAGKYTLVAIYDHDDFVLSSTTVNFEVYKANPTISVPNVDVDYNDSIVLNIESDVASIYTIEIEDYRNVVFVNGSRTIVIDKTLNPGNYTIKVTSQERVNYISNSTEAILNVNENLPVFGLSISNANMDDIGTDNAGEIDSVVGTSNKVREQPLMAIRYFSIDDTKSDENLGNSLDNNNLGEEYEEGKFLFQYDEDDDYDYFDTLEDAVDEAVLYGSGIITVRGGTYPVYGIDIEGEVELTIKAYENEEVTFDCGGEYYFMLLTYDTEMEWVQVPPPPHPEFEQTDGPTVTLENITVINGVATYGGAIDLEAGTLILNNCNFRNNHAYDEGGAIYIGKWDAEYDATLLAVNTTFTNNYAESEGGAIYIASDNLDGQSTSASFMLCTFLDNYQGEDDEKVRNYFAGGNANDIIRQYCIFNANGEIYNFTMDKINQAVYVNGTSNDTFDSVVLLYFDTAPLYAINNNGSSDFSITFEDVMGGNYTVGVMNDHDFNTYIFDVKFEMKVPNFIISEDEVYENLTDAIDAVSENGVIYANMNYYVEEQMGIDISKSFTLKNFRGRDVVFDGNSTTWFFTIAEGCTVAFEGIYFTEGAVKNHASIENYGTLVINNCTFDSFETGEIIHNSGLLNILNSTFTLNFVNNAVVWNDGQLFIDTVEFSSNIVNMSSVVYTNGAAEIISSNFTENYNFANGGAIYNAKSLSVKDTVFTENEGYNGGAVYSEGTLEVINSTFEDNTANGYGGAIYNGNEANIFNSTFTGSSSEMDGGAIYNNNVMTVDNSTLVGNTATGRGGAIYNNKSLVLTKSVFGINYAEEFANIYNAGDIQFSENMFDFYDVILVVPDGEYGIPTTITGTLNPEFNMDLQATLPGFVNHKDATVTIQEGVFEYVTDILPKGIYDVILNEVIYDIYGNIYYGEAITDRLVINKANVYINLTVDDIVLRNTDQAAPVLKISTSKDGLLSIVFNNKILNVNIVGGQATVTLDAVGEGNYTVFAAREGDENHNDAVNTTTFTVTEYEGNFIVNSTGGKYDTLREAIENSANDDIIYVMEGNYSGDDNIGLTISGKKLSIISLGDVVFDANSSDLNFLIVLGGSDVSIFDIVITGFNTKRATALIYNGGDLTVDGCIFTNNTLATLAEGWTESIIYNGGNLNVVDSEFYNNAIDKGSIIYSTSQSNLIVNESTFENNTFNGVHIIEIKNANSAKIISSVFAENILTEGNIIFADGSTDVLISSEFYNNTMDLDIIFAQQNSNVLVNNSIFAGNTAFSMICLLDNTQNTISGCVFTENTVKDVVFSFDQNLSVLESTFSDNTISGSGALNIKSASINGCVFTNNKANKYRNIYSDSPVSISNSVFDALNVDFTVYDIDYGQTETIEGTIDIGTNLNLPVNLDINSKTYSVNVTDGKFTYNAGILNGGDYVVVLNPVDNNSNTFVFDKITKVFTVNRVDPELSISIADITQGEKLKVNTTISKNASANVVYELDGKIYSKKDLENLTLAPGDYLVVAMYRGDKNFLSANAMANVKVHKVALNITVSDVVINYGDEIKVNVTADVADYYTVFIGNESVSLYVNGNATFTFPSENFKSGNYEIMVYVFETDDYDEAYAYATLTLNKAIGVFNLTNDTIIQGENATITVEVPLNAYGNIAYNVYDADGKSVYSTVQSCLENLTVPNLNPGKYVLKGTYEGDSYYSNESIISSSEIFVRECVDIIITVGNITYGENATVTVESNVDGEYLVYVGTEPIVVTVIKGTGNVSVSNLNAGSYVANVTVIDGNYSGFNETVFGVAPKSTSVDISIEDIVFGENAIAVVNGEIDGEYIIEIDNQNYTVNVVDGKGNTAIDGLAIGEDILASITIANANYAAFNTTTFNVFSKYNTPIDMDLVTDENNVTMTVTVNDKATGLVKFQVTGQEEYVVYSDVINGVAVLEDVLETGDYTVVATYMGSDRFNTNITYADFTIKGHIKKNTTISAHADVIGNRVTLTVNVDENATGFVKLTVGDTVANIEVVDGVATLTTILPANSYRVDVTYLGDDDFNMNNTMATFTIVEAAKENTTIDLNIIAYEDAALIVVDLNETTTGLVKFYMVSKETGENYTMYMDVEKGHVETYTNSIEPGNYTVVATYMGDSVFNTNTTSGDVEIFGHIMKDTPINATVETNGNRITLTVNVDENATGFVKVTVGGTVANIELENGKGILTTILPYGSYSLNITYLGDANYNKNSTKSEFTLVEPKKENTPIALDIVTDEYYVGMTATVSDKATGLVKFQVSGAEEYVVYSDVINGVAILEDTLIIGDYSVVATYMGDSRFNTNITYGDFTIKGHIKKDTTISASADVLGNRVTLTVKVDDNATGFVKLTIGGTATNIEVVDGVAKLTTTLSPNSYFVDVTYLGDDDFNMNSTKVAFTITEASKKNTNINLDVITGEDNALIMVDLNKATTGLVKLYMLWKETGEEYTMYMDVVDGHVETYTNSIEPGNYTIVATYMGDSAFNTNTTSQDVEIFGHVLKDTPITADVVANGNRVTLITKVDDEATGFVELKFGDNVFNIALEDGIGTLTTSLAYGSYSLDITYLGDENFNKNSTKLEFTLVEPAKATTPISMDIVTYEDEVWMTVSVDEAATGLVKFQVTGPEEFTLYVDVIDGKALVDEVLLLGDYSVVATYMGDGRFNTNITYGEFTIKGHIKKDTPITANAKVNGNRVTLTVKVDDEATGFVKLSIGGTVANIEVVDGVATLTTVLVPNSYLVDVTYLGDDDFNMNKTKVTFTITEISKKNTTIDLNIIAGEDDALIVVDLDKAATGLVKFYMVYEETGENYTMYMDVVDGHVETYTNSLEPGNYTVVATYLGDSAFNTNTTSGSVEILGHILKDTPITANVQTSANMVKLTVKVDENATGFVELKFRDNVFNIVLEDGIGTLTTSLPYGSYSLDITYLGDENFNKNSTKLEFTLVEPAKESTPISMDIVTYEDEVWMTVSVDEAATGLVKFQVTGPEEFTLYVDVIDGKALVDEVLLLGDYNVIATYMGDGRFNTNITSGVFTIKGHIKKDTPISASADVLGNRVTLTVKVDDDATGFVKLIVGGTVANIEVVDGVATLTTMLSPNSYYVDVTYLGDDDFNMNKTKVTFTITEVSKMNTNIDLDIAVYEDTAFIAVDLDKAATGLVKFYMVSKETGEEYTMYMDVIEGHVETFTNSIEPGNYTVVATYMGDSLFNTNTTSEDVEVIGHIMKDTPISLDVVTGENNVTMTVTVNDTATGLVKFEVTGAEEFVVYVDVVDGKAVLEEVLAAGDYSVVATYMGDSLFNSNLTSEDFAVKEKVQSNITIDVPDPIKSGENISVSIPGATGNVSVIFEGVECIIPLVDGKANFTVPSITSGEYSVVVMYPGDDTHTPDYKAISIKVEKLGSWFNVTEGTTFVTYAAETAVGEKGALYPFVLRDSNGNPIANATVTFAYKTVVFNSTTDENGTLYLGISTYLAQDALCAMSYLGDETHNATFVAFNFKIQKKPTAIKAAAKTYKVTKKYKYLTVTLKTTKASSRDGKVYLKKGKKLTLTVNGKTYKGYTNANGKVTFTITNLNKKGKYTAVIKYAGSDTYVSAKTKIKLKVY